MHGHVLNEMFLADCPILAVKRLFPIDASRDTAIPSRYSNTWVMASILKPGKDIFQEEFLGRRLFFVFTT
jgi:hypothetical protein